MSDETKTETKPEKPDPKAKAKAGIHVMLKPGHPGGQFRRSVRDDSGKILETILFETGKPLELNDDQFAAVMGDIGNILVYPRMEKGVALPVPDWKATRDDSPQPKKKK